MTTETRRVAVIGQGHVGSAMVRLLERHVQVVVWDNASGDAYPEDELATCAAAFIAVPTPTDAHGVADLSAVRDAISRLPVHRVILRSTVPPGTVDQLSQEFDCEIGVWPEYVGESSYVNPFFPSDISEVPFVIAGGEPPIRRWLIDFLLPILGPTKTYFQCEAVEAEMIKYAENCFFATKITFANEFRRLSEAVGADWHTVREGWLLDPRIAPMHTAAFEESPGFGGKCLPKDLRAIISAGAQAGYHSSFLQEVKATNDRFRPDPE